MEGEDRFSQPVPVYAVYGHGCQVTALCFGDSNKILVSGDEKGKIKIWDLDDFTCKWAIDGHTSGVLAVASVSRSEILRCRELGSAIV